MVNILVFLLAFFLDFFELAFIIVPLLAPVADKLGIDLIWFGVLLGVNMQTSFMHPPFGFALFYLRSVAPAQDYVDKITGKLIAPVTTGQIYWGAVPFVVIQLIMVGDRDRISRAGHRPCCDKSTVDPSKIEIKIPDSGLRARAGGARAVPDFGAPEREDGKADPSPESLRQRSGAIREAISRSCSRNAEVTPENKTPPQRGLVLHSGRSARCSAYFRAELAR